MKRSEPIEVRQIIDSIERERESVVPFDAFNSSFAAPGNHEVLKYLAEEYVTQHLQLLDVGKTGRISPGKL